MAHDCRPCHRFDCKFKSGGEANGSYHADGIFPEPYVRIAYTPDDTALKVVEPANMVYDTESGDVVKETVYCEVASSGVFLRCSKGIIVALEQIVMRIGDGRGIWSPTKRAGFDYL